MIATDGAFTYPSSSYGGATVASAVSTNCTGAVASGACELLLPPMSGYRYRVDVYNMSAKDAAEGKTPLDVRKRAAARFLIHTTFGPTRRSHRQRLLDTTPLEVARDGARRTTRCAAPGRSGRGRCR